MPLEPGDLIALPRDFCPDCMDYVENLIGVVTGIETDPHWKLLEEHPGPFYTVRVEHEHNTSTGELVYATEEMTAVQKENPMSIDEETN